MSRLPRKLFTQRMSRQKLPIRSIQVITESWSRHNPVRRCRSLSTENAVNNPASATICAIRQAIDNCFDRFPARRRGVPEMTTSARSDTRPESRSSQTKGLLWCASSWFWVQRLLMKQRSRKLLWRTGRSMQPRMGGWPEPCSLNIPSRSGWRCCLAANPSDPFSGSSIWCWRGGTFRWSGRPRRSRARSSRRGRRLSRCEESARRRWTLVSGMLRSRSICSLCLVSVFVLFLSKKMIK